MESVSNLCVDSDILIDYLRGVESARDFFVSQEFNFYITVISIAEIYSGKNTNDPNKQKEIAKFLDNFAILPITPDIGRFAGEIRRDTNKPFADSLVAASAILNDMALATRNVKHFKGIKNLKIVIPY